MSITSLGQHLSERLLGGFSAATVVEDVDVDERQELAPALAVQLPGLKREAARARLPMVSVVLATRNRARTLPEALEALAAQTYPDDRWELILVDDGSNDATPRVLESFAGTALCQVRVERTPSIGDAAARNLGAKLARGEVVAFTDGDCRVPSGWLEAGVNGFQRNVGVVAGPIYAKPEQQISFLSFVMQQLGDSGVYCASNIFYRREAFLGAGGFPEAQDGRGANAWGWDTATAWRVLRQGYQARFRPEAYLYHHVHSLGLRRWLLEGWELRHLPPLVRELPELRGGLLAARVIGTRESAAFELGLAGLLVALVRRRWPWLLLWLPWLSLALDCTRADWWPLYRWPKVPVKAGLMFVRHLVLVAGLAHGNVRARRPVL